MMDIVDPDGHEARLPDDWTEEQKRLFVRVWRCMGNQNYVRHPNAQIMPWAHWETIAWNAAWTAAEELVSTSDSVTYYEDGEEIGSIQISGGLQ